MENYLEYLKCDVDYMPCDNGDCEPVSVVVTCNPVVSLVMSQVLTTSAVATFDTSEYEYDLQLIQAGNVLRTISNPPSPYTFTDLADNTAYQAKLIVHCPYGEDVFQVQTFTTQLICATLLDVTAVAEEVE